MAIQVGINGFGRIGRLVFRAARGTELDVVGINDLTDAATLAHLLKYDSIHGRYPGDVRADGDAILVDGRRIPVLAEKEPAKLPWKRLGAKIVVESTGRFTSRATEPDVTIGPGKDERADVPAKRGVVSTGSCTTNSRAPGAKVFHDEF